MEHSSNDAGQPSSSHAHGPASEHSKSQLRAASAGWTRLADMAEWIYEDRIGKYSNQIKSSQVITIDSRPPLLASGALSIGLYGCLLFL